MADPLLVEILRDHVSYEIWMLRDTQDRLLRPVAQEDEVIRNALIESFCLHARQLIDFFENEQGVKASEFTDGSFIAAHTPRISKALRIKINTQIAHITKRRTSDRDSKVGPDDQALLLSAIMDEAQHFLSHLTAEYAAILMFAGQQDLDQREHRPGDQEERSENAVARRAGVARSCVKL